MTAAELHPTRSGPALAELRPQRDHDQSPLRFDRHIAVQHMSLPDSDPHAIRDTPDAEPGTARRARRSDSTECSSSNRRAGPAA